MSSQIHLDARNLLCPMPVIRLQDRAATLVTGDEVEVVCTDPGALVDIPAWCNINGHRVLSTNTAGDEVFITVRIGELDNG